MRAYYYASKLSDNISETPEGYLICRNVPIARTGSQNYLRHELGFNDSPNEIVPVYRTEKEVFSPATIASFEGKPLTDDHPCEDVNSENAVTHLKGILRDVRRGQGTESDKLLADLIVYERYLIDEIKNGKREVSCGYDMQIEEIDGKLCQTNIQGNHLAVVDAGRAGSEVRIKDKEVKKTVSIKRRNDKMTLKTKIATILGMTRDADPAELAEVIVDEMAKQEGEQKPATDTQTAETAETVVKDEGTNSSTDLVEMVKSLTDEVKALKDQITSNTATADSNSLEELEKALESEIADESEKPANENDSLENPEQMDEETLGDIDPGIQQDNETAPASTADKAAVLSHIRKMKPVIAGMKDAKQKKMANDSLSSLARSSLGVTSTGKGYKTLMDAKNEHLQKMNTKTRTVDNEAAAQKAYDSRNPHKNKGDK